MINAIVNRFVKNPDDTTSEATRSEFGNLSGFVGIICNVILFAIKLFAGLLSGSISITADAFNNLSDMGSSIVTMLGFRIAKKPADKEHPFGHGRMEYMSGFIVSIIIIIVGVELFKSSIKRVFNPEPPTISVITFVILGVSIAVKLWMFIFNRNISKRINSSAIYATARDSINDVVATSSVLLNSVLIKLFDFNADGYVGIIVAVFIVYGGIGSAREMLNPLLGEAPSVEFVSEIRQRIMQNEMFCGMHDMIVHNYGPGRCFVSVHVEVPEDVDILKCHEVIDECERSVGEAMNVFLVIHMDPVDIGEETADIREKMISKISSISDRLSLHDFRVVKGESKTNLIFDVVIPYDFSMNEVELKNLINKKAREIDEKYSCVISFDREYT